MRSKALKQVDGRLAAVLFSWVAILILLSWLVGCATVNKTITPEEALGQTQASLIAAINTLADAADAGIVSRDSDEYKQAKSMLKDARDAMEFAWAALLEGKPREAESWRRYALNQYTKLRPQLAAYAAKMEKK